MIQVKSFSVKSKQNSSQRQCCAAWAYLMWTVEMFRIIFGGVAERFPWTVLSIILCSMEQYPASDSDNNSWTAMKFNLISCVVRGLVGAIYGLHQALRLLLSSSRRSLTVTVSRPLATGTLHLMMHKQSGLSNPSIMTVIAFLVMLFILMIFCITLITKLCIRKHFKFKTGSVCFYLGYQIKVDKANFTVELNQSDYVDKLLDCLKWRTALQSTVSTPMVHWHCLLACQSRQLWEACSCQWTWLI